MAASQVAVDDEDALAGSGKDVGQVHGEERLADARSRSTDGHDAVRSIDQGELQRGPQAAQALDGEVGGILQRQERSGAASGARAREASDLLAMRNRRVDRQAGSRLDL